VAGHGVAKVEAMTACDVEDEGVRRMTWRKGRSSLWHARSLLMLVDVGRGACQLGRRRRARASDSVVTMSATVTIRTRFRRHAAKQENDCFRLYGNAHGKAMNRESGPGHHGTGILRARFLRIQRW